MNVLITGATGFIGRAVGKRLDALGVSWTAFSGDVTDAAAFEQYNGDYDVLLHLAGVTRAGSEYDAKRRQVDVNLVGTLNAAAHARNHGMRLLFAGTCSYGKPRVLPIPESHPLTWHEPYSFSKWQGEQLLAAWSEMFGLEGMVLRIFNVYGPEQPVRFLIPDLVEMVKKGRMKVRNLTAVRDYIYIDDLADLICRAIMNPISGMLTVNAGSGTGHSVGEVMDTMFSALGKELPVEDEGLPEFIPVSIADMSVARKLYGFEPSVDLTEGIRRVLEHHGMVGQSDDA